MERPYVRLLCGQKRPFEVLVDEADLPLVLPHRWSWNNGYAVARIDGEVIGMHRFLAGARGLLVANHLSEDRLDNRRSNLRVDTRSANRLHSLNRRRLGLPRPAPAYAPGSAPR